MAEERDMVSKIKTLPQQAKEGALEKEDRETVADSPLAGLSDAAVQLIRSAKHGEDILDLLGIDLLRGQDRVDLVMCDVATLLSVGWVST